MTWIRNKDRSKLKHECRLYVDDAPPRHHYFSVYVWQTPEALEAATPDDALPVPEELERDGTGDVIGKCCHTPERTRVDADGTETTITRPKNGGGA